MNRLTTMVMAAGILLSGVSAHADVKLVMFRHADKPAAGLGQLSCQGLNRALALPAVLLSAYGNPAALYAPNPGVVKEDQGRSYNYLRGRRRAASMACRASSLPGCRTSSTT